MLDTKTAAEWRGHELIDRDGDRIGTIGDVYLDRETDQPEWITVKTGLFGTRETFVPIRDATSEGEIVRVPFEKSHVKGAPSIDPDQTLTQEDERELYRHYGVDYGQERSGSQLPQAGGEPGQEPTGEASAPGTADEAPGTADGEAPGTADGEAASTADGEAGDRERPDSEEPDRAAEGSPAPAEGERGLAVPGESDREDELSAGDRRVADGATTERVTEEPVGEGQETRLRLKRYVVTEEVRIERDE
jgi:sporulation protein YlmC with PRC-barrel domain